MTLRSKLEQDMEKATTKLSQMSKHLDEKEEKYLQLYEENVNMHEKLTEFSSNMNGMMNS